MSKVKKKRVGFVLDMTPLVDITFLLLTFFMFTAKFKSEEESEQKFVIKRPQTVADTAKLPEKNLVLIKIGIDSVAKDTAYYVSMLNDEDRVKLAQEMIAKGYPGAKPRTVQYKVTDTTWLGTFVVSARIINSQAKFAIDADRRVPYRWVEAAAEVMRTRRATTFNFVTDKKTGGL
jgi:biopolymer transport protein ExbD